MGFPVPGHKRPQTLERKEKTPERSDQEHEEEEVSIITREVETLT